MVVGYLLWLGVEHFATYRPHEVALLAAGLGVPGVAALTAVPPEMPVAPARLRFGTSFVMASLIAEFVVTLVVAGGLVVTFVVSLVGRGAPIDVASILLGVIPILVAAGFVLGFRRWPSGDRRFLGVASTATFIVLIPLLLFATVGQGGFIVIPGELAGLVAICFVVNLAGLIGLGSFPAPPGGGARPTPTDDQRRNERGEGQKVARVADEPDVDWSGDGA